MTISDVRQRLRIVETENAASLASELFYESFRQPFPVPSNNCGLSIPTPPDKWRQFVALYNWNDGSQETVGFCNWIKFEDVYLEGGLCVKKDFYRRLPKEHWKDCRALGGVAQLIMQVGADRLVDCKAWFGYVGDAKSHAVTARIGYKRTSHPYLIVRWFADLSESERSDLIARIARIGPF